MSLFSNFPQSTDAEVKEIINALESRVQAAARVAVGSYDGTGLYGASYPNTITFDFPPKFVLIFSGSGNLRFAWVYGSNNAWVYSPTSYSWCSASLDDLTLSYFSTISAEEQMNGNETYYYVYAG